MIVTVTRLALVLALILSAEPALAHHVMGGAMPVTFGQVLIFGLFVMAIGVELVVHGIATHGAVVKVH